jgi:hypothetical protein
MMKDVAKIFPEGLSYVFKQTTTKLRDWRVDRLFRDVLHEDKAKYSGGNEPENNRYSKTRLCWHFRASTYRGRLACREEVEITARYSASPEGLKFAATHPFPTIYHPTIE